MGSKLGMLVHFDYSTQGADTGGSLSLKPAWTITRVPGQQGYPVRYSIKKRKEKKRFFWQRKVGLQTLPWKAKDPVPMNPHSSTFPGRQTCLSTLLFNSKRQHITQIPHRPKFKKKQMTKKYLPDKNVWWVKIISYACPSINVLGKQKDYLGTLELGLQMVMGPSFVFICMLMFRISLLYISWLNV